MVVITSKKRINIIKEIVDMRFDKAIKLLMESVDNKLMVIHKLSERKLNFAKDRLDGYLPAPSLAIINPSKFNMLHAFGDITLVVNPREYEEGRAKIYDGDIYSARTPEVSYEFEEFELRNAIDKLSTNHPTLSKINYGSRLNIERANRDGLSILYENVEIQYLYLLEGAKVKVRFPKKRVNPSIQVTRDILVDAGYGEVTDFLKFRNLPDNDLMDLVVRINTARLEVYGNNKDLLDIYPIDPDDIDLDEIKSSNDPSSWANVNRTFINSDDDLDFNDIKSIVGKKLKSKKSMEAFKEWVGDNFGHFFTKLRFYTGRTATGRVRYKPLDIDSMVGFMSGRQKNAEQFNYGIPNIRAKMSKTISSLKQVKNKSVNLVSEVEMKKFKDKVQAEFDSISDDIEQYHAYSSFINDSLVDVMLGNDSISNAFPNAPDEFYSRIRTFVDSFKSAPTEYFEIKHTDKLELEYFAVALVDSKTTRETKEYLKSRGMRILIYRDADDYQRKLTSLKKYQF